MKTLYPLRGIVTVLNTPFKTDGTINLGDLKRNVKEAMKAGVAGFLVPAMASEVYKLTFEERITMVAAVLDSVNGRVPVIAGTGEIDLEKSRELLHAYLNLGCSEVLFQIPFKSNDQFKAHFYELAEIGAEVIMLQDWDSAGYGLPDELILELFEEVDAFRCLKIETVPAGIKYSKILDLTNGTLNVSGGWAVSQMIEGLTRGVHAFMPTGMHWIYTEIYNRFKEGRQREAETLFRDLLPVLAFSNQHLDISIHFFKRLLFRQGTYSTADVRAPILPFDDIHKKMADPLIDLVIKMEKEIKQTRI